MGPRVKGGGKYETQPLQVGLWVEELVFQLHRKGARWLIAPGSSPVDQLSFRDGKGDVNQRGLPFKCREGLLK